MFIRTWIYLLVLFLCNIDMWIKDIERLECMEFLVAPYGTKHQQGCFPLRYKVQFETHLSC